MNENETEFSPRDADAAEGAAETERDFGEDAADAQEGIGQAAKAPAAQGRSNYDNPIGLTQAFAPVDLSNAATSDHWNRRWSTDEAESDGWDQIIPDDDTPDDWREPDDGEFSQEDENARRRARKHRQHHTIVEYDAVPDSEYETAAATSKFNEGAAAALAAERDARNAGADSYEAARAAAAAGSAVGSQQGAHAQTAAQRAAGYTPDNGEDFPDMVDSLEPVDAGPVMVNDSSKQKVKGKAAHGKHSAGMKELSVHERKSRKVRKTLIIVLVLLALVICALLYFGFHLFTTSQTVATQQAQTASTTNSTTIENDTSEDAQTTVTKKTDVPDLASLLGKTQDEAITLLGHGAQVRDSREVTDEGSTIKTSVTVPLTDEPADTKTGTPTVYLGLNEEGKIIQAGYSTSTSSLGFGAYSFVDMVQNNHIIERTLQDANVMVDEGAAVLPSDKMEYSTYDSDGTTLTRERYSFSGDVNVNGAACSWSAVLSYDYANANLTGNLADTVRVIYVYVSSK